VGLFNEHSIYNEQLSSTKHVHVEFDLTAVNSNSFFAGQKVAFYNSFTSVCC